MDVGQLPVEDLPGGCDGRLCERVQDDHFAIKWRYGAAASTELWDSSGMKSGGIAVESPVATTRGASMTVASSADRKVRRQSVAG